MKRKLIFSIVGVASVALLALTYLIMTGERGLSGRSQIERDLHVIRLGADATQNLGWNPVGLDAVFEHAATLSSDTLMVVTKGQTVGAFGDLEKPLNTHSMRKAFLSAVVGQHLGSGPKQIQLESSLQELGIDDTPGPLSTLQKQATVLHLLKSTSGINHGAAASLGLTADNQRRLGNSENKPGSIWAYSNWDYNALTTIFETQTATPIADAFKKGIADPTGMQDVGDDTVSYIAEPKLSIHKAASFRMSARDLAKFGQLYLDKGRIDGAHIIPAGWIDRITQDFTKTGRDDMRWGHGYLWWIPGPETGLPGGTFMAWGLGNQAVIVIPEWETVVIHQSDTTEFLKRLIPMITIDGMQTEKALEQLLLSCRNRANRNTEYCVEHRFIGRREFATLINLIGNARL